ncbi:protein of unknown function (plasmid) [Caballeronia sp. S22]
MSLRLGAQIQEVLRLLGEREWIAEKWTDALDRRIETVKRASKNSALLSSSVTFFIGGGFRFGWLLLWTSNILS